MLRGRIICDLQRFVTREFVQLVDLLLLLRPVSSGGPNIHLSRWPHISRYYLLKRRQAVILILKDFSPAQKTFLHLNQV